MGACGAIQHTATHSDEVAASDDRARDALCFHTQCAFTHNASHASGRRGEESISYQRTRASLAASLD